MRTLPLEEVLKRAHLSEAEEQRAVGGARVANLIANGILAVAHAIYEVATDFPARHQSYWH